MDRRDFIRVSGSALVTATTYSLLGSGFFLRNALGAPVPLDKLKSKLASADGSLLVAGDSEFAKRKQAYNLRFSVVPKAIVLCKSTKAIQAAIAWARENEIALHIRGGGHCFEGFSSGEGLLLDMSPLNSVSIDAEARTARIGAGAKLGQVIPKLWEKRLALTTGTCPTVGVTGLTLGGGYGMLSRKWGLTCDNLISFKIITADGALLNVNATENEDLFWACRGSGGGHFGVVTELTFRVHPIKNVITFALRWPSSKYRDVMKAWQAWAPTAADEITCHLNATGLGGGDLNPVKVGGLYVPPNENEEPSESKLKALLKPISGVSTPELFSIKSRTYADAVEYFAGGDDPPIFFKNKSDIATSVFSDAGHQAMIDGLKRVSDGAVAAIFSAYGGAIGRVAKGATSFPHREQALFGMQYICHWSSASKTAARLKVIRELHDSLRPHFSGGAYVNYPDEDLKNWGQAYYGDNFTRLREVKAKYDPSGFFRIGAQTIPVG